MDSDFPFRWISVISDDNAGLAIGFTIISEPDILETMDSGTIPMPRPASAQ